jgi:predicted alpha/beta-hydrolase family hydrolase
LRFQPEAIALGVRSDFVSVEPAARLQSRTPRFRFHWGGRKSEQADKPREPKQNGSEHKSLGSRLLGGAKSLVSGGHSKGTNVGSDSSQNIFSKIDQSYHSVKANVFNSQIIGF